MEISSLRQKALEELQRNLKVNFSNLELLNQALTHSSKEPIFHNERLEFLGDAVLGVVVGEYLFRKFPYLEEGALSKLKGMIVSEENLSRHARKIGIKDYILVGKNQEGIQSQDSLLADVYEAIIGAIYLDKGWNVVFHFVVDSLIKEEEIQQMRDFKSDLQEYTQSLYKTIPEYELVEEVGPDHLKRFRVKVRIGKKIWGEGWGSSKKRAEKRAAQSAWEKIKNEY